MLTGAALLVSSCGWSSQREPDQAEITGAYASLLADSEDLGSSDAPGTSVAVGLRNAVRPAVLFDWAGARRLSVRWRPGESWAILEGGADDVARAFAVPIHDYRGRTGQVFYASARNPRCPGRCPVG